MHMHDAPGVVTSEELAPRLDTNPVVLRRTMSGLREAGIVRSERGRGGGWSLVKPLETVTLVDVYDALAIANPFGIGCRSPSTKCLLERTANEAIGAALADAEATLMDRLRQVTVADLIGRAQRLVHGRPARRRSPDPRSRS